MVEQARKTFIMRLDCMDAQQRYALARLHVYEFANARGNQIRNQALARKVAAGLTRLALDPRFGDMTGQDYMDAARKVWVLGGKVPLYSPHHVIAGVDFEAPR